MKIYDKIFVDKNVFENISIFFLVFKQRRKHVQDIFKVSPCSKFQLDI